MYGMRWSSIMTLLTDNNQRCNRESIVLRRLDLHLGEWQAAEELKQRFNQPKLQIQLWRYKDSEDRQRCHHQVHSIR